MKKEKAPETAQTLGAKIREISISEFFSKNRHLLGFDNPIKSLLTTVREGVDNALDACEEARILPEIQINIRELKENRFLVSIEDNGPGIQKSHLPNIFGKLLYGSKFHRLKQSRGQQGIGISAAVMYGQMTTGKPSEVISKTGKNKQPHRLLLQVDTKKNAPKIVEDELFDNAHWQQKTSGTIISIELEGAYKESKHGVLAYIRQTALSNSHADIFFTDPKEVIHHFPRLVDKPPIEPKEIKPHPHGIELGTLLQFMHEAGKKTLVNFLQSEFSRVPAETALALCKEAKLKPTMQASNAGRAEAEALLLAITHAKLTGPATNCLSPLGEESILKALYWFFVAEKSQEYTEASPPSEPTPIAPKGKSGKKPNKQAEFLFEEAPKAAAPLKPAEQLAHVKTDEEGALLSEEEGYFVTAISRPPAVYRGNPFQVEVGLFYGRDLSADEPIQIYRYANRVPLQYQASACAMTKSVMSVPWKSYGLQQARGALPLGPLVLMISISSVWVPYTSESKEAVAHYPEIIKELRLGLMEAGRRLQRFLNKRKRQADEAKKRGYIEKYLEPIGDALADILGFGDPAKQKTLENLQHILEKGREHKQVKMASKRLPK